MLILSVKEGILMFFFSEFYLRSHIMELHLSWQSEVKQQCSSVRRKPSNTAHFFVFLLELNQHTQTHKGLWFSFTNHHVFYLKKHSCHCFDSQQRWQRGNITLNLTDVASIERKPVSRLPSCGIVLSPVSNGQSGCDVSNISHISNMETNDITVSDGFLLPRKLKTNKEPLKKQVLVRTEFFLYRFNV